jgi:hypothetical protein
VVAFLSQDWLDRQRLAASELPVSFGAGASAVAQVTVTGGPGGDVGYTTTVEQGRLVAAAIGQTSGQPDLVLSVGYDDAVRLAKGEVDLSASFMQGRLKAEGDMRKLFAVLATDHRPEARALVAEIAADTQF